ncbi:MAG: hypothetical protein IJV44_10455 [Prevotella sp.]|nr:hypothetical protein [Prevotella sp.]
MNQVQTTEKLEQMLYDSEISRLEFAQRSPEHREAFAAFCQDNGLTVDDQAAERFFDWLLKCEEKAHTMGLD